MPKYQLPCRTVYSGQEYEPFEIIDFREEDVRSIKELGAVCVPSNQEDEDSEDRAPQVKKKK